MEIETSDITTSDITRYFKEMLMRLDVAEKTKIEIDRLVAPDFNLFSILQPNEVSLSKMIACLLDPSGSHGQGSKFLLAFLDMLVTIDSKSLAVPKLTKITGEWGYSKNIKSKTEQTTDMIEPSQRRMDILVWDDVLEGYGLMIENKPWADDQKDQLKAYREHLSKRFRQGKYAMIYLSGDGTPPSDNSILKQDRHDLEKQGELLIIAYRPHLTYWLQQCLVKAEADRVRWIIKDFIAYIEAEPSFKNQAEAQ